jgi:hypothetical protein
MAVAVDGVVAVEEVVEVEEVEELVYDVEKQEWVKQIIRRVGGKQSRGLSKTVDPAFLRALPLPLQWHVLQYIDSFDTLGEILLGYGAYTESSPNSYDNLTPHEAFESTVKLQHQLEHALESLEMSLRGHWERFVVVHRQKIETGREDLAQFADMDDTVESWPAELGEVDGMSMEEQYRLQYQSKEGRAAAPAEGDGGKEDVLGAEVKKSKYLLERDELLFKLHFTKLIVLLRTLLGLCLHSERKNSESARIMDSAADEAAMLQELQEVLRLSPLALLRVFGGVGLVEAACDIIANAVDTGKCDSDGGDSVPLQGVQLLGLGGCNTLSEEAVIAMVRTHQQLKFVNLARIHSIGATSLQMIGQLHALTVLNLSGCKDGITDASIHVFATAAKAQKSLRALNLANAAHLTDTGLNDLGEALGSSLQDLCIYGCFRVTDTGLLHIAHPNLKRLNHCGCYKVSQMGRRYLFSVSRGLLMYNKPKEFAEGLDITTATEPMTRAAGILKHI